MIRCCTKPFVVSITVVMVTASPLITPNVLCVGSDGHVAIETNVAGARSDCDDFHLAGEQDGESQLSWPVKGSNHCDFCDDYDISQCCWHQLSDVSFLLNLACCHSFAAVGVKSIDILRGAEKVAPFVSRAPPRESKTLASLHTVIIIS